MSSVIFLNARTCSDCGRPVGPLTRIFDPNTRTEMFLCPVCLIAFRQREHFAPGCCGGP
jgi:hypothetical protein